MDRAKELARPRRARTPRRPQSDIGRVGWGHEDDGDEDDDHARRDRHSDGVAMGMEPSRRTQLPIDRLWRQL